MPLSKNNIKLFLLSLITLASCSPYNLVPEEKYMLDKVEVVSEDKTFDVSALEPYVRQQPNSKWFSLFKVPLGTYSLAGRDTTKWLNRTLRNMGEAPVIYDSLQMLQTCEDLRVAVRNKGFFSARVNPETIVTGSKRLKVKYVVAPGNPYFVRAVKYDIKDDSIRCLLESGDFLKDGLREGMLMDVNKLDDERKRITSILLNNGYYRFNKDYITYSADSVKGSTMIDLTLHLHKYGQNNGDAETSHPRYLVRSVSYSNIDNGDIPVRRNVLHDNTWIEEGDFYSAGNLQRTYNSFSKLPIVKSTNIRFSEVADTTLLDCNVILGMNKLNSIAFLPEGTNTAGDLGAAASLTYENRNLFKGAEVFSVKLRAAFEAITGLEGYQNQDYEEYSVETKLSFPRFVAPFLSSDFKKNSSAQSELAISYNMQNRPEFHRRVFSAAWRYRWTNARRTKNYKIDLLDLNYIYMPWMSSKFKHDYLDSVSNRNAILRFNYEDLFITKIGFGMSYTGRNSAYKFNVETSGNLLNAISGLTNATKNAEGQYTLFNIAFAQYVKADFDYTHKMRLDANNDLVFHVALGVAYPYGNSTILPFEKRYFSGGANSVRGWSVRGLGPGKYRGVDGAIDFINQAGDVKLDLNLEYRTFLFWKLHGALFVDAGNIWTLRSYEEQPDGQFDFRTFYEQLAVSYGLGVRLNFDYFILRFDMGMKAINPAYESSREHYAFAHPKFSRDFAFHFAVGLPF